MNFELSEDLRMFLSSVERVVADRSGALATPPVHFEYSVALQRELGELGFLDCAGIEELGRVGAVLMIMALAHLPQCVELTGSGLVAPVLGADLPRPVALSNSGPSGGGLSRPIRFLPVAGTIVDLSDSGVQVASLRDGDSQSVDSPFAYPVGRLVTPATLAWRAVSEVDAQQVLRLWQLGLAAEIVGSLAGGLAAVVEHVKERRQFGRPLGSFQAIQHRLAECAVLIDGARWLVLKAAAGLDAAAGQDIAAGPDAGEVVLALAQAQRIANQVPYDLHQFMGAMGLTLEHPLHRWTYRARLLRSELGGAERHYAEAARLTWTAGVEGPRTREKER